MNEQGGNTMTKEEMIDGLVDNYSDFQMIKKEMPENVENFYLDYKIKTTTAKLSALGVNVEDITIKK